MTSMIVRHANPFNAGPPLEELCRSNITPVDLFFVRNHGDVPTLDPASYRLSIEGTPRPLSLDDVRHHFAPATLEATLQCVGNRRREKVRIQ